MSSPSAEWWIDDLQDVCVQFQLDLSCLVDGELDEVAGGRAIAHLEECESCSAFFDDTRNQIRAHRELSDPEALLANYSALLGTEMEDQLYDLLFKHVSNTFAVTRRHPIFVRRKSCLRSWHRCTVFIMGRRV